MIFVEPARVPVRRTRPRLGTAVAVAVAAAAAAVAALFLLPFGSEPLAASLPVPGVRALFEGEAAAPGADGDLDARVSVFDEGPAVANLDADLRDALHQAASAADEEDVTFFVTSGWRSPEFQERLLREAVAEYGSAEEAARWVATAETSPHVHGEAVDIGLWDATAWLSEHGAAYGLCQVYANEPWHYELRPDAVSVGCPEMFDDPTQDPRMAPQ